MMEERRKKLKKRGRKKNAEQPVPETEESAEDRALNCEHEKLIRWLQTVKFRKVLLGGVDEAQLWKKLEELDRLYEAAIGAERARYDALLKKQEEAANARILRYQPEPERRGEGGPAPRTGASESRPAGEELENGQ